MVWIPALSLSEQVERVGAYVGIASFFGIALLAILYFAQARELKRLRDWAGRAPERARELEERVAEDAARRAEAQPRQALRHPAASTAPPRPARRRPRSRTTAAPRPPARRPSRREPRGTAAPPT